MFALEIEFRDETGGTETVFIRRPFAVVSGDEAAHVVIDDLRELGYGIEVTRGLGRRFYCKGVAEREGVSVPRTIDGEYENKVTFNLETLSLTLICLDIDLMVKDGEALDKSGARVMRLACSYPSPGYPAVMVISRAGTALLSFSPLSPVLVGRSKECPLRLDTPEVSAVHARIGYEEGEFWIEDLGSTNGTYVYDQQVSGRVSVNAGVPILIGPEITLIGVTSDDQIERALSPSKSSPSLSKFTPNESRYPIIIAVSEVVRPARCALVPGATMQIGRDPRSDIWLGAPHVSRTHCTVTVTPKGEVLISDHSTNGTLHEEGVLERGDTLSLGGKGKVLNFGAGLTLGICFSEKEEQDFINAQGDPLVFLHSSNFSKNSNIQGEGVELASRRGQGIGFLQEFIKPLRHASRTQVFVVLVGFIFLLFVLLSLLKGVILPQGGS